MMKDQLPNPYMTPLEGHPKRSQRSVTIGRIVVVTVIVIVVGISVMTILLYNLLLGNQKLPTQVIRLALTIGLAVALYRGHLWARNLMVFLFGIASVVMLVMLPKLFYLYGEPVIFGFVVATTIGYALSAIALTVVPDVAVFLEHQRNRKQFLN